MRFDLLKNSTDAIGLFLFNVDDYLKLFLEFS